MKKLLAILLSVIMVLSLVACGNKTQDETPSNDDQQQNTETETKTIKVGLICIGDENDQGYTMVEDAGRGYRQVVPSPKPIDVIEKNTVKALVDNGTVVITVGGGGIPVVRKDGKLYGTPAVIDKDFASAKLAELLDADMLVILTAVEKVAINFGKPDQKGLDDLTPADARKYIEEKQFAPGSMLPKVQAALSFAESKPGRVALITLLEKAADGISGKTGTRVHQ